VPAPDRRTAPTSQPGSGDIGPRVAYYFLLIDRNDYHVADDSDARQNRMIKYIRENKQWLFSGIGVTILLGLISVASWLLASYQKPTAAPASGQVGQTSTAPSMIPVAPLSDQKATPDSIMKEIDSARPLQREDVAKAGSFEFRVG
jgi:hypothetical protein